MYDRGVGLLSAGMFAFYPTFVYGIILALDEHLFLPLWFFGLYLLLEEIQGRPRRYSLLWYGLIFGYATMTRTHTLFMPIVVAYAYFLLKYSKKRIFMGLIAVFVISQVPTVPWVIRNYRIWNDYIPYSASAFELYESNNAAVRGGNNNGKIPNVGEPGYAPDFNEAVQKNDIRAMQRIARREVVAWILGNPVRFMGIGTVRVLHFLAADRSRGVWSIDLVEEALKLRPDKTGPVTQGIPSGSSVRILLCLLVSVLLWMRLDGQTLEKPGPATAKMPPGHRRVLCPLSGGAVRYLSRKKIPLTHTALHFHRGRRLS
jgi:4-amino-4-deoxy-L-arabinose transferase-like glycosyltransferase